MNVALAICTHNRRALLKQTLACAELLVVPDGVSLSVILVTNACTDGSAELAGGWGGTFPLAHENEPAPGVSHARNRALRMAREASAALVVWVDDDVLMQPDFLLGYLKAFDSFPLAAVFGGRVLPHFLPPSPVWLPRVVEAVGLFPFSCFDLGGEQRNIEGSVLPFGANMAVRTSRIGDARFDPRLGPSPSRKVGFDETVFLREVLRGDPWVYVPESSLRHVLPPARQSLRAVAQYHRAIGHYQGITASQRSDSSAKLLGVPRWAIRSLVTLSVRIPFTRFVRFDRFSSLRDEAELYRTLGFLESYGHEEAPEVRDLIR